MKKVDCRAKIITRDKEGHSIIIKGTVNEKSITILNIYAPNNRPSKYVKQKLMEPQGGNRQIHNDRDFSTSFSIIARIT